MFWRIPRSIFVALVLCLALWISGAFVACYGQEADEPCVLVYSVPEPTDSTLTHYLFEFRQVGRALYAIEDEDGEYFMYAGPAFEKRGMVCFDVDYVDGNPDPTAQVYVSNMGETYCYYRQEDGTLFFIDDYFAPDPAKTAEAYREICADRREEDSWHAS